MGFYPDGRHRHHPADEAVGLLRDLGAGRDDEAAAIELSGEDPSFAQEADQLAQRKEQLEQRLEHLLVPRDALDAKDVILEVKAGEGGDESALFAADLLGSLAWQRRPAWAARWCLPRKTLPQAAAWLLAPLPLVGWYAYHFHRTGHIFGNPDYLRYNVGATLTPWRILIAAWMRLWHAVGYMNLFVLTAPALLLWWQARREAEPSREVEPSLEGAPYLPSFGRCGTKGGRSGTKGIPSNIQLLFVLVVLAQAAEFSIVGGALLARYMIPAIPLVILLSVDVLARRAPRWRWWITASAAAFVVALLFNPPWYIAPEDNLTWAHFVQMHQRAARYAEQHYANERILTAWPASDELNRPFLGYVQQPLTVVRVENFTPGEMLRAREQEESFDVVLAFSTKFEPRRGWMSGIPFFARWRWAQKRYFDYHEDLPPAAIARLLEGRIVYQESSPGEWVALIELDKVRDAGAKFPGELPRHRTSLN